MQRMQEEKEKKLVGQIGMFESLENGDKLKAPPAATERRFSAV